MTPNVQIWLPPMLTLLGTLIVVVFTAWLSGKHFEARLDALGAKVDSKIDALWAEMKQGFAELRLEFHTALSELTHRVERIEERLSLVQQK